MLATQLFFVGLMGKYQLSLHIFKIRSNEPGKNILHLCWRIRESEKYRYTFKVLVNLYHPSLPTPGIRILGTGSNTKNRIRQVTTTFSAEYAIFILSDRQRY
jgi:hypothetical protein